MDASPKLVFRTSCRSSYSSLTTLCLENQAPAKCCFNALLAVHDPLSRNWIVVPRHFFPLLELDSVRQLSVGPKCKPPPVALALYETALTVEVPSSRQRKRVVCIPSMPCSEQAMAHKCSVMSNISVILPLVLSRRVNFNNFQYFRAIVKCAGRLGDSNTGSCQVAFEVHRR